MDPEKALSLVGLSPGAPPEQVASAFRTRREQLAKAQAGAPTDGLRAKFQKAIADLDDGWRVVSPGITVPSPAAAAAPPQAAAWGGGRAYGAVVRPGSGGQAAVPGSGAQPAVPPSGAQPAIGAQPAVAAPRLEAPRLHSPSLGPQPPSEAPTLEGVPSPLAAAAATRPAPAPPPPPSRPQAAAPYTGSEDATVEGLPSGATLEAGARQVEAERAAAGLAPQRSLAGSGPVMPGFTPARPQPGVIQQGSGPLFPHGAPAAYPALQGLSATQARDLPGARPSHTSSAAAFGLAGGSLIQLDAGRVLAGRFEIRRRLGAGGMGAVFAALDRSRNVEVAIKVLLPELLADPKARQRFIDEARVSTELAHPNIVRVYDLQQDGDLQFLTMELLKGRNLRDEIAMRAAANRRFEVQEALAIGLALCDALAYAHTRTVHRDVKPENVWLSEGGGVKLMDFGIARMLTATRRSTTGVATGTAYYIAPEQLKGAKELDGRADEYSLGVLLYELIAGELPLGKMEPLASLRKDVPPGLSRAIDRMLEVSPDKRFPDVAQARAALAAKHSASRAPLYAAGAAAAVLLLAAGAWLALGGASGAGAAGDPGGAGGSRTTALPGGAPAGAVASGISGGMAAAGGGATLPPRHGGGGWRAGGGASAGASGSSSSSSEGPSGGAGTGATVGGEVASSGGSEGEGSSSGEGASGASSPPVDDAAARVAATEARGRATVIASRLAEVKQGVEGRLAEAGRRLEQAQRGGSEADPARRRAAEAKLADAGLEQKGLRLLDERLAREVFGSQDLADAQGKLDAGERLLREREFAAAADAFAKAEPALEALLAKAQRQEMLAACEGGKSRADAARGAWERLRGELKLPDAPEAQEAARALGEANEMASSGELAGAAQRYEQALRGFDQAIEATHAAVDRASSEAERAKKDPGGRSSLHNAVVEGNLEDLRMGLKVAGAAPDALDADGNAPLHLAVQLRSVEAARVLLEGGAQLEVKDSIQRTPLHWAAAKKDPKMLAFLLEKGAAANAADESGDTPLELAARGGFDEGLRILLEKGANPNVKNEMGFAPLDHAVTPEGRALLQAKGARRGDQITTPERGER